jgi:hypothetical protein
MLGVEEAEMSRVAPYIPPPSPDSTGGVLIVHRPPALQFTTNWPIPDWCAEYAAHHAITSASQQVNRIDAEDQGVNAGPKVRRGPVQ